MRFLILQGKYRNGLPKHDSQCQRTRPIRYHENPFRSTTLIEPPRSRTFVTAFARGLQVIEAFGHDARRMSLSEVAERTGLDRAVARRLLLTLAELGFV